MSQAPSGFHFMHSLVNDLSGFAYSEIVDGKAATCAEFLGNHPAVLPVANGKVERFNRSMKGAWAYR